MLLCIQALTLRVSGKFEEAIPLFEEALQGESTSYITIYSKHLLTDLYKQLNRVEDLVALLSSVCLLYAANFPYSLQYAHCLNLMGIACKAKETVEEEQYQQAIQLFSRLPCSHGYAQTLYNLGLLRKKSGRREEALQLVEESKQVYLLLGATSEVSACNRLIKRLRKF